MTPIPLAPRRQPGGCISIIKGPAGDTRRPPVPVGEGLFRSTESPAGVRVADPEQLC